MATRMHVSEVENLEALAWWLINVTELSRPGLADIDLVGENSREHRISGEEIEEAWEKATWWGIEEYAAPEIFMRDWFVDQLRVPWIQLTEEQNQTAD